jgi:uncharacterized protein YutE (UPF0331/DUF86 family)
MPKYEYAKGRIEESLQYISSEIKEFDLDYGAKTWVDYQNDKKLQKLMDRTIENVLTALIEVCGTILVEDEQKVENYSQVLAECGRKFGFSKQEQDGLAKLAIQRNRMAHRYLNFRWQAVVTFKELKPLISMLLLKILESKGS